MLCHVAHEPLPLGSKLKARWLRQACDAYFPTVAALIDKRPEALMCLLQQADNDPLQAPGGAVLRTVLIEFLFERVRGKDHPALLHRTESVFMFSSKQSVRRYLAEYLQEPRPVYECEVESGDPFFGDMALINRIRVKLTRGLAVQVAEIEETASLYWRGGDPASMDWPEALAPSGSVKVLREISLD